MRSGAALLAGSLAVFGMARADVLVGADGSRLQGTLVATKSGRYVFDSTLLGRVEVATERANVVVSTQTTSRSPGPSRSWSADVSAKLGVERGSLRTPDDDLDAALRVERRTERGEWLAVLDYGYRRTDEVRKENDVVASVAYDHLRGPRSIAAGRLYGTRELRSDGDYDSTRTASFALGWRGWEGPDRFVRVGPAIGYVAITRGAQDFDGSAVGLYARARGPVGGRVSVTAELQLLDTLGDGRYGDLALQLRHPLSDELYVALTWDYTWSQFDIESGISSEWHWVLGWTPEL